MTLLHITIKAQTQKHIVQWTQLLRAFPLHGSGAVVLLSNRTGITVKGARVLILEWPKPLVREYNTMWALTSKSHCRYSQDGMMTGRCGQRGSEFTQSWPVGPRCSRWQKRKLRRSRWLGRLLMRFDWVRPSMLFCWRRQRAKISAVSTSQPRERELRLGGF